MTDFHTALEVDVEEDLLPLCVLLQERGIAHRVYEQGGHQVLKVGQATQVDTVRRLYEAWRSGELSIELSPRKRNRQKQGSPGWRSVPVTMTLVLLSCVGFLLYYLRAPVEWLGYLTFTPFQLVDGRIAFDSVNGQYWRLVTPVFLHFGWLHIVFNGLWLWELGSKVERTLGHWNMLMLFLTIAVVSNGAQFAFGGQGIFGGMSGVIYGLLGFSWVAPLFQPGWDIRPSPTIMVFMVGWLVACMAGVVEVLGFGAVANAAHLGGLICGAVLGVALGLLSGRPGPAAD